MWGHAGMEPFAFLFVISYHTRTSSNKVLPTSVGSINLGITCFSDACLALYADSNMTTNISSSSIVVEVLRDDNYDDWSACMKSYMLAHDLWGLIEPADHQEVDSKPIDHREGDSKAWIKKNAAALHAIQISCSPHILSKIRSIISAKVAWDTLANSQQQQRFPSQKEQFVEADSSQGSGALSNEMNGPLLTLYKDAHEGEWDATKNYLSRYPDAIKAKIKPFGGTALDVASSAGNLKDVEEFVKLMSEKKLEIQDDEGSTALFSDATVEISCSPRTHSKSRSIIPATVALDTPIAQRRRRFPMLKQPFVEAESSQGSALVGALSNEMNRGFSKNRGIILAKVAKSQQQHSEAVSNGMNGPLRALYKHAHNGDWDAIRNYLRQYPDAKKARIKPYGGTALHVAAYAGNLKLVEELVKLMSVEELEIQDNDGDTALSGAATVGIIKMAECLVSKNKNLVTLANDAKRIPLVEACRRNHKDLALYLYSVTPVEFLCQDNGIHGSFFLQYAIGAQMLDIAYDFLHRLTTTMDVDGTKLNALISLSLLPGIFQSGNRLALWQQWIYSCISIEPIATAGDNFCISMPDQSLSGLKKITLQVLSKLRGFAINLLTFLGIKQIYDLKKIHIYSNKILQCLCKYISNLDFEEIFQANIHEAFYNAVKNGKDEFVIKVIKACPLLMVTLDDMSRHLFMSSIANRQEKVFSLLYGLEASRETFVSFIDSSENTMLHLAAKLSPPSQLARISGAALQMQRELQWYKEVESIMNPRDKDLRNDNNQIARELFTHDHKDLLVKGEQWMKEVATSCTVVGALIITIMFTAVFTVPGGNVQETGYPVLKDEKSFKVFIVADAISLFSSSTSVLMFLGILTSRYAEEDFLKSLPTKLIFGLSTLFLSIATMMVTFCAALIIMLNGRLEIVIPAVLLASIPVTFFMLLQFPLLVEIFVFTFGPGIFNKKMKRWY